MTQVLHNTSRVSIKGLAGRLNDDKAAIGALTVGQTQYTLDPTTGDCVYVVGPDISMVPINSFTSSPSMASTGLSGAGAASKSTGTWVQL